MSEDNLKKAAKIKPKAQEIDGVKVPEVADVEPDAVVAPAEPTETREPTREREPRSQSRRRPSAPRRDAAPSEFVEKVITIKRVTKVTKGNKRLNFSALVVVGDGKGRVGYGLEKAGEVALAIKKSLTAAKKRLVRISLKGTTIPHEIIGTCGAASVLLKPAAEGTGVIAAGPVRAVCDGAGIRNILTKCHKSNNPINVVKATFDGLNRLKAVSNIPTTGKEDNATPSVTGS